MGSAAIEDIEEFGKMDVDEFCSLADILFLLLIVHHWLQTNLKHLILNVKHVVRDVYVVEQKFKIVINHILLSISA
ncbi:unnamed protein product [Eruca vesicaria subsp. sativa]|uniref:Uncharacterized protein n=1 Tax=Eruca vesicaria subsp. sativa TaxID=29727 RepID=A0ABC8L917_ERUVS|nr:unnamed protein product [Eruca vesicaria subsp. sativa]